MTQNEYAQEVFDYMVKKLPDVNQATLLEITEFFVMKSNNYASDMVAKNSETWLKHMKRNDEWYLEMLKRYKCG